MTVNKITALFVVLFFSFHCRAQFADNVKGFLEVVKNGEYIKAKSFLCRDLCKSDPDGIDEQLKDVRDVLKDYGIPDEKTWTVKYDTAKSIVKLVHYTVPLYKTDKPVESGNLEYAFADLDYEYTKVHTGDSVFNFRLRIRYKH